MLEISFTPITKNDGQSTFRRNVVVGDRENERDRETKIERGETERDRERRDT